MPNNKNRLLYSLPYLIVMLFILSITFMNPLGSKAETLTYSEFTKVLKSGEITKANVSVDYNTTTVSGMYEVNGESHNFTATIPNSESEFTEVMDALKKNSNISITDANESSVFLELLGSIIPILLFLGFGIFMLRTLNSGGGANKQAFDFSKSRARLESDIKVRFHDVAGCDEEKEEMAEIIEYLKTPRKFAKMGARIPKGILMVGSPGTGKTLLAKAVAGEANVPFYSISGSDFVEMFVGVGASRVRDLFEQAKKNAPAIIFIDEIDAVGRKRGAGLGGGHDEREQTLNQLLVEMDGFGVNQGIIIMAATNRPDILDPALLRPGRFDRQIVVGAPDVKGREAIFKVHSKNKPLADDVNIEVLARRTPGFTPADIENLMNEAAILTARKREKKIHMETIEEAITKVIAGVAKKSRVISEPERKLTAYHEAGHAVCAHVLPHVSPVHQVTIVPRGRAGGFTMQLPVEDKFYATKNEMKENIVVLLGGRVAEELTLDDISTGASNDLERVSATARNMVTKYGMSEKLGPMTFGDSDDEVFLGNSFASKQNYSEEVAYEIDKEIGRIVDESYKQTKKILQDNMDRLEYVAKALLVYETLDAEQFLKAFNKELPLDVLETKKDDETNNSEVVEKKETLSRELQSDTDLNRRDEFSQGKIDKDENK